MFYSRDESFKVIWPKKIYYDRFPTHILTNLWRIGHMSKLSVLLRIIKIFAYSTYSRRTLLYILFFIKIDCYIVKHTSTWFPTQSYIGVLGLCRICNLLVPYKQCILGDSLKSLVADIKMQVLALLRQSPRVFFYELWKFEWNPWVIIGLYMTKNIEVEFRKLTESINGIYIMFEDICETIL